MNDKEIRSNVAVAKELQLRNKSKLRAFTSIPYSIISKEYDGKETDVTMELTEIAQYYDIYKRGSDFDIEGTNGDYVGSNLRYRKAAMLINKEARFLFGNTPDMRVEPEGDAGLVTEEAKKSITNIQNLIDKVLEDNEFEAALLKAAKDCFIGKRIGYVLNFNEDDGVSLTFLKPTEFIYEISKSGELTKFVCIIVVRDRISNSDKRIFKKKYELVETENGKVCYIEEMLYDGAGVLVEEVTEYQETLFDEIPAGVIFNDGLTGDSSGESEIAQLMDNESYYSKLANADMDSERKSMNQIKYTVDMDSSTTSKTKMSTSPGSYWEFTSDQNLDKPHPSVGTIESSMNYSVPLNTTLERIKRDMHEIVEVPDVSIESIQGIVTSGKALKAVYWPLIVRCNEKMKTWGPQLKRIMKFIYKGSLLYPNCIVKYTDMAITIVNIEYKVEINYPLPEDEEEEKNMDMAEVDSNLMSKKAYMKKWRGLTDQEADEELEQMLKEKDLLENSSVTGMTSQVDNEDELDGNLDSPIDDNKEDLDDDSDNLDTDV